MKTTRTSLLSCGVTFGVMIWIVPTGWAQSQAPAPALSTPARLSQQLKSPIWTEQLDAARQVFKSGNAGEVAELEAFASHPFAPLREVAAQAMVRKHQFSPALKTLFYEGADLNWEPKSADDYALATFALITVELQANADGYRGKGGGQSYHPYEILDPRMGDLLATRLRDRDAYGVLLFRTVGFRNELLENTNFELTADLKAKVLEAWQKQRVRVKNPFTEAQLETEMARVRQIRYNNFEKGPYYEEVIAIVKAAEATGYANFDMDAVQARIAALPPAAAATLFEIFHWRSAFHPPRSALQLLADSGDPGAFVQLAQVAYGRFEGSSRIEAIRLMDKLDPKRARPHIEAFFKRPLVLSDSDVDAPRLGAALVLARRGEKRAVPAFFAAPHDRNVIFWSGKEAAAALQTATGLEFTKVSQWRDWWEATGSKMEWN